MTAGREQTQRDAETLERLIFDCEFDESFSPVAEELKRVRSELEQAEQKIAALETLAQAARASRERDEARAMQAERERDEALRFAADDGLDRIPGVNPDGSVSTYSMRQTLAMKERYEQSLGNG